jgi:aspartyl-tRNA(Asn)/glutamyl-tRNA(Gln) amidotransferase subunit C
MTTARSVVTVEVVRKVADLARLRLPDEDLPRWTEQLSRILAYIDQLAAIPESAFGPSRPGPATPVRPDAPVDGGGLEALEANAPRQVHGYGVVPRVVGSGS